ncbi:Tn3 family transposase [Streptomyces sp. NPDC017435]|uniref:Tn3 family transposase n=1 Tax=Streptomyces sp. NPDC017435 TaxID=3364995 RepID=UPI003791A7E8
MMLAMHLLQSALVHVNTLLLQQVLAEPAWAKRLSDGDRRGLTALFWSNINPYGTVRLDMDKRLDLLPALVPGPRPAADDAFKQQARHPAAEPEQHRRPRRDHPQPSMDVIQAGAFW